MCVCVVVVTPWSRTLSNANINENSPANTVVGALDTNVIDAPT